MRIDAHLHLPVLEEGHTYPLAKEKLLADLHRHQVDYAILIPDNQAGSPIGDLPACLELVKDTPQLFLVGTIDLETQGKAWVRELGRLRAEKRIVGMKIFPGHDPIYPTDPRLRSVYELCQAHGMPMVMHTGWNSNHPEVAQYNDPKYIVQVAERYPRLKIIIAHYFWPEVEYCFALTHGYANICYDTSGLADAEVVEATGREKIEAVLLKTLAEKPRSVLFGSDYAMCSIPDHLRLVQSLPVSEEVREGILWKNAVEAFMLKLACGRAGKN
jgi:predicted TIM-barrel fold metal-dependent hydrolase